MFSFSRQHGGPHRIGSRAASGPQMLKSAVESPAAESQPPALRMTAEQMAVLEAEFNKMKTLHETDLELLAAEMALSEKRCQGQTFIAIE
ncbi:hypothetical protein LSTR_LSTR015564 [Laodelphax striatellus]|uniref:Homeobox domain-containing protein n=1 Tax=Laodelphax striatellus TaxID=195883 RepID=A0A482WPL2_LAOST|nr:hypothetical protein LSTR_LSTR015564 [Laodelphax striatellus]